MASQNIRVVSARLGRPLPILRQNASLNENEGSDALFTSVPSPQLPEKTIENGKEDIAEIGADHSTDENKETSYSGASTSRAQSEPEPEASKIGQNEHAGVPRQRRHSHVRNALSPSSESSSSSESLNADEAVLSPDQSDDVKEEPENIQEDLVRQASQEEVDVFKQIESILKTDQKEHKPSEFIYVEQEGCFKRMRRSRFAQTLKRDQEDDLTGLAKHIASFASFIPPKYRDVQTAYVVQQGYHTTARIFQGLLSGMTIAHAVFAIHFATEELLLQGYRYMSLPVHVVFSVFFTIACVSAYDRLGLYGWSLDGIHRTISHGGFIGLILYSVGLASSVFCIEFDEELGPRIENPQLTPDLILTWRICCGVRAFCSSAGWLMIALRPDVSLLGETIRRCVEEEVDNDEPSPQQSTKEEKH